MWSGLWNAFPKLWVKTHKTHTHTPPVGFVVVVYLKYYSEMQIINEWPETPWIWIVIAGIWQLYVRFVCARMIFILRLWLYDIGTRFWYRFGFGETKRHALKQTAHTGVWRCGRTKQTLSLTCGYQFYWFGFHLWEQFQLKYIFNDLRKFSVGLIIWKCYLWYIHGICVTLSTINVINALNIYTCR